MKSKKGQIEQQVQVKRPESKKEEKKNIFGILCRWMNKKKVQVNSEWYTTSR